MTNFQKLILEIVDRDPLRQLGVAEKLSVTDTYVSNFTTGIRKLSKNIAKKIEEVYGYNAQELLKIQELEKLEELNNKLKPIITTGEGEMLKTPSNLTPLATYIEERKDDVVQVPFDDYMEVEYADLSAIAGKLGFENPATLPPTKKKILPKEYEKGNYVVLKIDGDSMDNKSEFSIPNGCDILVKEYHLNNGEKLPLRNNLFVLVTTTGTVFKQIIEQNTEEGFLVCHSFNEKYKNYKIELSEILQIFIYRKIISNRPPIPEF